MNHSFDRNDVCEIKLKMLKRVFSSFSKCKRWDPKIVDVVEGSFMI